MIKHLTLLKKWLQWYSCRRCLSTLRLYRQPPTQTKQIELVVPLLPEAVRIWLPVPADAAKTIYPSASGLSINRRRRCYRPE